MSYGINPLSGRCRRCGRTQVIITTDGWGGTVERPNPCACPKERPAQTPEWRSQVDRERRLACICQLCDEPVVGKPKVALYCELHRAEKRAETQRKHLEKVGNKHAVAYRERNREQLRKKARERARRERHKRNEYKRAWRKLNRDKVRAQKERAALKAWKRPHAYEYQRTYRREVEAGIRQPKRARRNLRGERLCVSEGCHAVMEGRAKKCGPCKARDAKIAARVIGRAA